MAGAPAKSLSSGFCWRAAVDFTAVQPHHHLFSPSRRTRCWWCFYYSCCRYLLVSPLWIRMLSDEEICERQENRHQRLLEFQPQQGRSYKAGTPLQNVGKNPICRPLVTFSHEKVNSNLSSWRYRRDVGGRWGEPVCTVRRKQWGFKSCARASAI